MKPILVFQTDFTYKEGAISSMYGVVKSVDRTLEIMDGSHELPQFDIWSASYRLSQSLPFWPSDTIYVSVVDPGVGTARKGCVALLEAGYMIVTPDNGTLTHIAHTLPIKAVREIDESIHKLQGKDTEDVSIFHGRDVFGYTAARLASGIISFEDIGPLYPVDEIVMLPMSEATVHEQHIDGIVEINDPNFGNVWTNVPIALFLEQGINYGDMVTTVISHKDTPVFTQDLLFTKSFGDVEAGEDLIYHNELNRVSLATCIGSFESKNNIGFGPDWTISFRKAHV